MDKLHDIKIDWSKSCFRLLTEYRSFLFGCKKMHKVLQGRIGFRLLTEYRSFLYFAFSV